MTIALTGAGSILLGEGEACDPTPFLRTRKSRKFMGLQDELAVVAAGRALASAGLAAADLGERAGLFLAVGYIPFLEEDIAPVLAASMNDEGDRFDVRRFGAGGFQKAHPLLTFRCLPNMPAYHVSACFDVQGPYFVTYPGGSEFYSALDEARYALESGLVDIALAGAVAAQSNFLVQHHFSRIEPPQPRLHDVAAMLVLERAPSPRAKGKLEELAISYVPPSLETYASPGRPASSFGPAALPHSLSELLANGRVAEMDDELVARDGVRATSRWSFT
ncbi:MAG: beta-ketoacyl synthase N-terminal-like domain-containing protein [Labilithrix sp.]